MRRRTWKNTATKRTLGGVIAFLLVFTFFTEPVQALLRLPDTLQFTQGQLRTLRLPSLFQMKLETEDGVVMTQIVDEKNQSLAQVDLAAAREIQDDANAKVRVSLFGILPLKTVDVRIRPERVLIPGGQTLGISLYMRGVLVLATRDVTSPDGSMSSPARDAGLLPSDMITEISGKTVTHFDQVAEIIEESKGKPIAMLVKRREQMIQLELQPKLSADGNGYRIGAWLRSSTAGVGTLSFFDPESGRFGALGHAITDGDTGVLLDVRDGAIYPTHIVGINQGKRGEPGEIKGTFEDESTKMLGTIDRNNSFGIYGRASGGFTNVLYPDGLPIALQSQVREGPAQVLTSLDDSGVKAYDCRVVRVTQQTEPSAKSLVIEITDPELLSRTGGIVQGMSGSPIIQDGRIIGAVTHVYINDPTRGYGIFIEWMLQEGGVLA